MGRRKTAAELQRQLQYAQAREAYTRPPREAGSATRRQPKSAVKYVSIYEALDFTVQASTASVRFFGGVAALGLADAEGDPTPPRGFRPATINAMVADTSPAVVTARGSNRPYIRYGRGTRDSGSQYTYKAPISAGTSVLLKQRFNTVSQAAKADVGGEYGRIWLEPERMPMVESGTGGVAP